MVLEMDKWG